MANSRFQLKSVSITTINRVRQNGRWFHRYILMSSVHLTVTVTHRGGVDLPLVHLGFVLRPPNAELGFTPGLPNPSRSSGQKAPSNTTSCVPHSCERYHMLCLSAFLRGVITGRGRDGLKSDRLRYNPFCIKHLHVRCMGKRQQRGRY